MSSPSPDDRSPRGLDRRPPPTTVREGVAVVKARAAGVGREQPKRQVIVRIVS